MMTAFQHVDNRYYDGPHYDRRYADYTHDIDFWCGIAATSGPDVLELAVGTGRLSTPLAESGHRVVGIDIAPAMLVNAAMKLPSGAHARYLVGDMRRFTLGQQFDLVMIACSSVCHLLSDTDVIDCFKSVRRHLRPSGTFAMDLVSPGQQGATADGEWHPRFRYPNPTGLGEVVVTGRRRYDVGTRLLTDDLVYEFTADARVEHVRRLSRMYPLDELERLLERSGLCVRSSYGGFDRSPLEATSTTQILLCSHG